MAQRLVRAKGKIRDARHPVPRARARPTCPTGCAAVLAVVYLIFNEGYTASSGDALVREDLCAEAIRLGRLLARADARRARGARAARADAARSSRAAPRARRRTASSCCSPTRTARCWDRELIAEGQALVRRCLRRDQPGPVPAPGGDQRRPQRRRRAGTDWRADRRALRPAAGARADARSSRSTARSRSPRSTARRPALALVDGLDLDGYHLFHAVRADLLRRLGRDARGGRRVRRRDRRAPTTPPSATSSPGGARRSDDARFIRRVNRSGDGPRLLRRACCRPCSCCRSRSVPSRSSAPSAGSAGRVARSSRPARSCWRWRWPRWCSDGCRACCPSVRGRRDIRGWRGWCPA